jgi:hypothetical protein
MKLVYRKNGNSVEIGDKIKLRDDEEVEVTYFREPTSPNSSGKVTVRAKVDEYSREYYVGIIGATWIEREDQQ